uniref:Uncharacterized protein n=1 Tax=Glossina austeni TaxID=7395 RepID=A0A1A9UT43_GLOAU
MKCFEYLINTKYEIHFNFIENYYYVTPPVEDYYLEIVMRDPIGFLFVNLIKYPIINEISNALCYANVTYNRLLFVVHVYVREIAKIYVHKLENICICVQTIENVYNNSASNIIAQHARIVSCIMTIGIGYVETTQCTSG